MVVGRAVQVAGRRAAPLKAKREMPPRVRAALEPFLAAPDAGGPGARDGAAGGAGRAADAASLGGNVAVVRPRLSSLEWVAVFQVVGGAGVVGGVGVGEAAGQAGDRAGGDLGDVVEGVAA